MINKSTGTNGQPHKSVQETDAELFDERLPFDAIPVIDFEALRTSDSEGIKEVAAQLRKAAKEVGAFFVKNHNLSQQTIDQATADMKAFFNLPIEEKMKLHAFKQRVHRGYLPPGEEQLTEYDENDTVDHKEAFDICEDIPDTDEDVKANNPIYGPNVWPESLPELKSSMEKYYREVSDFARQLLEVAAVAMGMPQDFFDSKLNKQVSTLRLAKFPPLTSDALDLQGLGPHTNYSCFAISAESDISALEFLNSEGEWIETKPVPGALLVNVGEMIGMWSNDLFPPSTQRVIVKSRDDSIHIMQFFSAPNYHTLIECLPTCQDKDNPAKHTPVVAGEYLIRRFAACFIYDEDADLL